MPHKSLTNFPEKGEKELIPERARRATAALAQWLGWGGAIGLYVWSITTYNPSEGRFAPQWVGSTFIGCLFVGIVGTMIRSRHRLSDTILAAFKAGVAASARIHNSGREDK